MARSFCISSLSFSSCRKYFLSFYECRIVMRQQDELVSRGSIAVLRILINIQDRRTTLQKIALAPPQLVESKCFRYLSMRIRNISNKGTKMGDSITIIKNCKWSNKRLTDLFVIKRFTKSIGAGEVLPWRRRSLYCRWEDPLVLVKESTG